MGFPVNVFCVTVNVDLILSNYFSSYQNVIEDIAMKMGVGMAKFIRNEVCTYLIYCSMHHCDVIAL